MASPTVSDELREIFREELREDPNATLADVQLHLAELCESGPSDSVTDQARSLTEVSELLEAYHGHTPLADLISRG